MSTKFEHSAETLAGKVANVTQAGDELLFLVTGTIEPAYFGHVTPGPSSSARPL